MTVSAIAATVTLAGLVLAGTSNPRSKRVEEIGTASTKPAALSTTVTDGARAPVKTARPASAAKKSGTAASPADVPANDDCSGAVAIPDGPFPLLMPAVDLTDATPQEEDDGWHPCSFGDFGADRTIWYSFTPSVTASYIFSTCAGNGAVGNTVYDTVISIAASIGGACPVLGSVIACNDTATQCVPDVPDAPYVDQSIVSAALSAGQTYYIAVGHWTGDTGGVIPGFNDVALQVDVSPAPANDTCDGAVPLTLNHVTEGTTESSTNDYRSVGDATCFTGIGQMPNTGPGNDVVYSFTVPADGKYSFRYVQDDATAALRAQNPTLYLSDVCPPPNPTAAVPCIKAANRILANGAANGNRSEEIDCVPLTSGEEVFLFFDDRGAGNLGGPMAVEVTECTTETEPNDSVATAMPYPGCYVTGKASTTADVDFYDLGAPPAGAKVFLAVDAVASNDGDFELRLTNATDTLGYDDNDGTSWISSNAPVVAGVFADGSELYARVNKGSSAAQLTASEPYHLYARIETGTAQDEVEPPDNASYYFGNHVTGGGFVRGVMATQTDQDCFRFVAHEGDEIAVFSDNNPDRVPGTITNVWPVLRDVVLAPPTASRFVGQIVRNNLTPSPGTLTGTTPSVTSEFFPYRARYTGTYMACFTPTQDEVPNHENPSAGAYPLPYQGSISINCGPIPAPVSRVTDVAVTQEGPTSPQQTGAVLDYTITITNENSDIAEDIRLVDVMPEELIFMALGVDDGFAGNNVGCISLPTPGTTDAPVDCTVFSLAPGASAVFFLQAQLGNCLGAGINVANVAEISTLSTDPNPANDTASLSFTTSEDGTCTELLCDPFGGCIVNACAVNGQCNAGACVTEPLDCDDGSLCTDDTCDPTDPDTPCLNDSSQQGDLCFDGNDCTLDSCDPLVFCVFPSTAPGSACDDFLNCTTGDSCDGNGACVSVSVCDDGLPCTDDFADELNACACDNPISFVGQVCDDGNSCTSGTVCDGVGGTAANCNGGTTAAPGTPCDDANACTSGDVCDNAGVCSGGGAPNCDDSNPCTDDSCNPGTGVCDNINNTAGCDDGNACTTGDACSAGACTGGTPVDCNDNNACTDDSCNPGNGLCQNVNNTAGCSDGNACTTGDTCSGGACVSGAAVNCNDSNPCTDDSCDSLTGLCGHLNNTAGCDDGSACTAGDVCSGGACVGGTTVTCNDGNGCTNDACNPANGLCEFVNNTASCNDGNACTTGDACAAGSCASGTAVVCNDNNACTDDTCNPATGCVFANNTAACNDGNACTTGEACSAGACAGGTAVVCNDNNACTADSCNQATGCVTGNSNIDATGFSANRVDGLDLVVIADAWNACPGNPRYDAAANLDQGAALPASCVDTDDFHLFMNSFGQSCP
jgi:hypothetical protein